MKLLRKPRRKPNTSVAVELIVAFASWHGAYCNSIEKRLRVIERFLAAGGAIQCDLPRIRADRKGGLTWDEFKSIHRGRPVLVIGAAKAFGRRGGERSVAMELASRQGFLAVYGARRIKTNNGYFDHLRSKEVVTVAEYLERNVSDSNIFLADRAYVLQSDVTDSFGSVAQPALLEGFDARPILSLAVQASATMFHRHAETWQLLFAGLKAWWITRGDALPGGGDDPCTALSERTLGTDGLSTHTPEKVLFCVQKPGEVLYFGDQLNHATCNLDKFVLGVGAQGRSDDWMPLHRAARNGQVVAVRKLLEEGGKADLQDTGGNTALHRAVAGGHLPVVELLTGAGADLKRRDESSKHAALAAAERGDLEIVKFLVAAGAPLRRKDNGGAQAVHWAALSGHEPVLSYLLERRASVHARDSRGTQPVHWAALESDVSTMEFLVRNRADPHAASNDSTRPLHWAAGVGHASIVGFLLGLRADPGQRDGRGSTPLHFAAAQDRRLVVRWLLDGRADVHVASAGQGGMRPVHAAAGMGHRAILSLLLKAAASVNDQDAAGRSPVHAAAEQGHVGILAYLASRRAALTASDPRGVTPAALAASRGHVKARDFLSAAQKSAALQTARGTDL